MRVSKELDLTRFEFWSGASEHRFTNKELQELEYHLQELYPDGIDETTINDIFWFEDEMLCEWLGLDIDEYNDREN